jgi:glycosyltransferase involved in cell wall biosynthesis
MTENDQIRGPVRYIYELVSHLDTEIFEVFLIAGIWQKGIYGPLESIVHVLYFDINQSKISRALFFIFRMPWILRSHKIGVYHIPDTNPLPLFRSKTKVVSTIHDVAEYVVPYRFAWFQSTYRRVISKIQGHYSDFLITVSETSKSDLTKYLKLDPNSIEVVYQGVTSLTPTILTGKESDSYIDEPYVLYVGVLENAKNVDRLVEGFFRMSPVIRGSTCLYLVGRKGNGYPLIAKLIEDFGMLSQIKVFGYVDNQDLDKLYRSATVFAYLSEYEGFGLPLLEAMRYGLPVLTSNKSCLPEVAGIGALIVETDIHSISVGLEQLLSNETLRKELSAKGLLRAAEFNWEETARKTQEIYLRASDSVSRKHV